MFEGPFFCQGVNLEAAKAHYNGIDWHNQGHDPLWWVSEVIAAALGEVVEAHREVQLPEICKHGQTNMHVAFGAESACAGPISEPKARRFVSVWRPVDE
jgi:hypothetical protein